MKNYIKPYQRLAKRKKLDYELAMIYIKCVDKARREIIELIVKNGGKVHDLTGVDSECTFDEVRDAFKYYGIVIGDRPYSEKAWRFILIDKLIRLKEYRKDDILTNPIVTKAINF